MNSSRSCNCCPDGSLMQRAYHCGRTVGGETRPMAGNRRPTPEQRELEKKKLQLDDLQKQLVERELELETMRGGLIAFEKKYQTATSDRYAMLDELRFRIAELRAQQDP